MRPPLDRYELADAMPVRGRGNRLPATLARIEQGDEVLRQMRLRYHAGASGREAARRIQSTLKIYRGGRWRRDRVAMCPSDPRAALCWRYLKLRDAIPSERSIRRAIRGPREPQ